MKKAIFLILVSFIFTACSFTSKEIKPQVNKQTNVFTNYVSDSYYKRNEGYDWVSVNLSKYDENSIRVKVRSRADKKRPTCTLDEIAYKIDENKYNF